MVDICRHIVLMTYHDIECPYCNEEQDICHDDGYGYEEDKKHEMQCRSCEKEFVFLTTIIFSYEARKADCLNDGNHLMVVRDRDIGEYIQHSEHCNTCDNKDKNSFLEKEKTE